MAKIEFRLSANILKTVVFATLMIIFVTACNNEIQLVSVYKMDGSIQCQEKDLGLTPEKMQLELTERDIQVHKAYKSNDGLMHIQLCGTPTGNINVFEISKKDIDKAQALGFVLILEREKAFQS